MNQTYPYDAELAYHFCNLALAAEAQSLWEVAEPDHPATENLFAIPYRYYSQLFIGIEDDSAQRIYDDIQGYIQARYELVGVLRIGTDVISDFDDTQAYRTATSIEGIKDVWTLLQHYSKRIREAIVDNVMYRLSQSLIGFVLRYKADGHGIIVIRGTMNIQEWLNNLNYRLVPFHSHQDQYGRVHNGFRDIYKGIRGQYRQHAARFNADAPLYLVGHSLGAAVSQLAALDIALQQPDLAHQLQVYGFASPRLGDAVFVAAYDELIGSSYQVANVCDVVPYIPSERLDQFLNFEVRPYARTKGFLAYVQQMGNPVDNHIYSYHVATRLQIPQVVDFSQPQALGY